MANEYTRILSHPLHIIAFIDSSNLNNTCQHEINQKIVIYSFGRLFVTC